MFPGPKAFEILLSGLERTHRITAEESHRAIVFLYESSGECKKKKVWPRSIHTEQRCAALRSKQGAFLGVKTLHPVAAGGLAPKGLQLGLLANSYRTPGICSKQ